MYFSTKTSTTTTSSTSISAHSKSRKVESARRWRLYLSSSIIYGYTLLLRPLLSVFWYYKFEPKLYLMKSAQNIPIVQKSNNCDVKQNTSVSNCTNKISQYFYYCTVWLIYLWVFLSFRQNILYFHKNLTFWLIFRIR